MWFAHRRASLPVLGFWFHDTEEGRHERAMQWLGQHPILMRDMQWAEGLVEEAIAGRLDQLRGHPHHALSLILLMDPMARVLFRGRRKSFAGDQAALAICLEEAGLGHVSKMTLYEQLYFHLPLMHSEDPAHQAKSFTIYEGLYESTQGRDREVAGGFFEWAIQHHDVIRRFGRFPDRNIILGRRSTPEERTFLHRENRIWFSPQHLVAA